MQRTIITMIIAIAMIVSGCSAIQTTSEDQEMVLLISTRMASRELAKKICSEGYCTGKLEEILKTTDMILGEARKGNLAMINVGKIFMLSLCEDEDLKADLSDIIDIMGLIPESDKEGALNNEELQIYLTRMQYALEGFQQGLRKTLTDESL